jgi:DNA-binding IclR family transcriptional regulator
MIPNQKNGLAADQGALKGLREIRKDKIAKVTAMVQRQRREIKAMKAVLKEGGQTIPQLAEKTGLPSSEVFWYLSALKKYGEILEGEKEGSYFLYKLATKAEGEG